MDTSSATTSSQSMLEHLGGLPKLRQLVRRFHELLLADDLVGDMFAAGKPTHSAHLAVFFEEVMGGRTAYTDHLGGVGGLYDAHRDLEISEQQRQRFVSLMMVAADEVGLPTDERFRSGFRQRIEDGSGFSKMFSQPGAQPMDPWPPVGTFDW